jgi:DNA-binding SARP family transcriptional activator
VPREAITKPAASQRIRINVFGSFSVMLAREKLPDSTFDRRRSRDLLMLLAVAPLHRMPRYQIVEQLWPGEDYIRGPRKLYEVTGEARKRLRTDEGEANPVVSDKAQGSVGLNPAVVGCDVDDFLREAIAVLSEDGDDYAVLERARRMEQIYAGGPDAHVMVLGQRVVDRVDELKSMYVDGMVAAGEAALRLGRGKLAVRYAQEAHRLAELREDAMILLVHALRTTGRAFEIPGVYRRFARTLIESQGVPPSAALRQAVDMATNGGYEAMIPA